MVGRNKRKQTPSISESVLNLSSRGCCFPEAGRRGWTTLPLILKPNTQGDFTQETGVLFESTGTSGKDACNKTKAGRKPERLSTYWPQRRS